MQNYLPVNLDKILRLALSAAIILSASWVYYTANKVAQSAHSGTHMMLLWDGTDASVPSGWTVVTTYNGKFPRGDSVANVLSSVGAASHTPTAATVTVNATTSQTASGGLLTNSRSTAGHSHATPLPTLNAANNLPAFRSLKLIQYTGIPNVIPAGAIAFFDDAPGIPAGWTRQSAQDNQLVRLNSAVAAGGSDTHSHTITWDGLGAGSGSIAVSGIGGAIASFVDHSHAGPAATATSTANATASSSLPPYTQVVVAKADADTATIPEGLISMFDGDPGSGWNVRSNAGGTFNQRFLRGGSTFDGSSSLGSAAHTHSNETSGLTTGGGSASGFEAGTGAAAANHQHTVTASFNSANHIPDAVNVVVAEKVGFTLSNYRWYADSNAENVTDPWGRTNIAQNTAITTLPAQNDAPTAINELRLRVNLTVSAASLPASNSRFKLQYKAGTDSSCTSGAWTDVGAAGGGSIWRYAASGVADGTTLTASQISPASNVLGAYIISTGSTLNPAAATIGQTVEFDFHIEHNGAAGATKYSFRVVEPSDLALKAYSVCPTLTTAPAGNNLIRHGGFFEEETKKGHYWAN